MIVALFIGTEIGAASKKVLGETKAVDLFEKQEGVVVSPRDGIIVIW